VNYQRFLGFRLQTYKKVSGGGTKLVGGRPVCGSVPMGLLKRRMCGSGL